MGEKILFKNANFNLKVEYLPGKSSNYKYELYLQNKRLGRSETISSHLTAKNAKLAAIPIIKELKTIKKIKGNK